MKTHALAHISHIIHSFKKSYSACQALLSLVLVSARACSSTKRNIIYFLLTVIIRWSESVLLHGPSGWKDHEVGRGGSRLGCGARQHGEDGRILRN